MWEPRNTQTFFSLSSMYPDRSNLNYVGPYYYEFSSENRIYDDFNHHYMRNDTENL
ncbi:hypothetical protein [Clostridium gasigenes]|uniref:Uncharacterized protein n=1 Tax=Clostridium gasigenes TaxID=94869 RepID=A0A7X0SD94_9CLOT|nr:hypothetical protein [Clostridium gasigenes]MBB6713471.1 hypothetical protein [Clostridium gasigenes]MBU3104498.1 hypothetical protein [Clostridium gasigenes]MBU3137597.1 hypothetical protein [Clostridium gasigenes]